jgi:hypothetical protein
MGAHLKHTEYRIWKKCMASFITSLDPRLLGRKSKHKPPKSWNYALINDPALSNRKWLRRQRENRNKNRGLLGWIWGRQLRWGLSSDTDRRIILLILVSKLLAQHLLKLNLFKRLGILISMRLGQTGIVGSWLRNKSDLVICELPQKFGGVPSPYLNPTEHSHESMQK